MMARLVIATLCIALYVQAYRSLQGPRSALLFRNYQKFQEQNKESSNEPSKSFVPSLVSTIVNQKRLLELAKKLRSEAEVMEANVQVEKQKSMAVAEGVASFSGAELAANSVDESSSSLLSSSYIDEFGAYSKNLTRYATERFVSNFTYRSSSQMSAQDMIDASQMFTSRSSQKSISDKYNVTESVALDTQDLLSSDVSEYLLKKLAKKREEVLAKFDSPAYLKKLLLYFLELISSDITNPVQKQLFICALIQELYEYERYNDRDRLLELIQVDDLQTLLKDRIQRILGELTGDPLDSESNMISYYEKFYSEVASLNEQASELLWSKKTSEGVKLPSNELAALIKTIKTNKDFLNLIKNNTDMQMIESAKQITTLKNSLNLDLQSLASNAQSLSPALLSNASSSFNLTNLSKIKLPNMLAELLSESTNISASGDIMNIDIDLSDSPIEIFVRKSFSKHSRNEGLAINKQGAKLLQSLIVRDLITVNDVISIDGTSVFRGSMSKYNQNIDFLINNITQRLVQYNLSSEIKFALEDPEEIDKLVENFIDTPRGIVTDTMGIAVDIIFYPANWTTSTAFLQTDDMAKMLLNIFNGVANAGQIAFILNLLSDHFAVTYKNLLLNTSPDNVQQVLLDKVDFPALDAMIFNSFLPLLVSSVLFNGFVNSLTQFLASKQSLSVFFTKLPSFNIPTYGSKVTLLDLPRDVKALFDIAFIPQFFSLSASLAALLLGISFTNGVSSDAITSLPIIDLSILQCSGIVKGIVESFLNPIFIDSNYIHIHWLSILGMTSFIAGVFQLLPYNGNLGAKMSRAALGKLGYETLNGVLSFTSSIYLISCLFNLGQLFAAATPVYTLNKLLFEFLLWRTVAFSGNAEEELPVRNPFKKLDDLRKLGFYACVAIVILSLISPNENQGPEWFNNLSQWFSSISSSGPSPTL